MIETVKVSSRGQIVIPELMREELDIDEGTKLILVEKNGTITIETETKFLKKISSLDLEKVGMLALAEKSLKKIWDNEKDDVTWSKYL